jgi:hypothetical protein
VNEFAKAVKVFAEPRMAQFRHKPWAYRCSEGYFRKLAMVTVLERDLVGHYNQAKRRFETSPWVIPQLTIISLPSQARPLRFVDRAQILRPQ